MDFRKFIDYIKSVVYSILPAAPKLNLPEAQCRRRSPNPLPDQTLNASALSLLRSDIIACRLMPNVRLRVEALRERYGMSISPIREALMRLEAEGLVELEQNKGFKVAEVSRENLLDLMRTRIEIESIALRWSLEKGPVAWEANLLSAFHRLSRQAKIDPANPDAINEAWSKEHADFHAALVAGLRVPDAAIDPCRAFRTSRTLCFAFDHVERTAARRCDRAQAIDAGGA